jgi:hypothetical protein
MSASRRAFQHGDRQIVAGYCPTRRDGRPSTHVDPLPPLATVGFAASEPHSAYNLQSRSTHVKSDPTRLVLASEKDR